MRTGFHAADGDDGADVQMTWHWFPFIPVSEPQGNQPYQPPGGLDTTRFPGSQQGEYKGRSFLRGFLSFLGCAVEGVAHSAVLPGFLPGWMCPILMECCLHSQGIPCRAVPAHLLALCDSIPAGSFWQPMYHMCWSVLLQRGEPSSFTFQLL